ncbi:ARGOS-like protein [Phragmites australis]|uniref:ARGOS-like protein n=1 Tax=Phragmites australis TaxID=29695 RepID=UPI002D76E7D6|nr:ARGOS-like protein [Phragmites australis]
MPSPPWTARLGSRHKNDDPSTPRGFCANYLSVESRLLLALVTVLLLVLPLVLPPLPPPPMLLLLVPVAMLAVLLLLALTPSGSRNNVADPASYL